MKSQTRPIIAAVLVLAAAFAFWTLALSPARKEADELATQVETLTSGVESARSEVTAAEHDKHVFPTAYRQLVGLGQAVPATDETPSLLLELETLAKRSHVHFESIALAESGGETGAIEAAPEVPTTTETAGATGTQVAQVVPATEAEASLLPLGASIGSAGLATMPYTLAFHGSYFDIAKFIGKIDDLVKSGQTMQIDGRLVTIGSFTLAAASGEGGSAGSQSELQASFTVTTYLTPPGQGITAGATPSAPAEASSQTVAAE
jgi:Tfp pilus assembly protein PilO